MSIVGSIGLSRNFFWVDEEHYGNISGNFIGIHHITKGIKDCMWYNNGISCVDVNYKAHLLAVAPIMSNCPVEIIEHPHYSSKTKLINLTESVVISLSFSYSGKKLLGLTDQNTGCHKIICWNLSSSEIIIQVDIEFSVQKCIFNPNDDSNFILFNDIEVKSGNFDEVLGDTILNFQSFSSDQEHFKKLKFLTWLPCSYFLCSDEIGCLHACNTSNSSILSIGQIESSCLNTNAFFPYSAAITSTHIVISSDQGEIIWIAMDFLNLIKSSPMSSVASTFDFKNIELYFNFGIPIKEIIIDSHFENALLVAHNCSCYQILIKLPDIQDLPEVEEKIIFSLPQSSVNLLFNSSNRYIILSTSCAIPMIRSDVESTLLSCLVTVTSSSTLEFWKIPELEHEYPNLGRRLPFRAFNMVKSHKLDSNLISSITFQSNSPTKRALLFLGSTTGMILIYKLMITECDEDVEKKVDSDAGIFDDDGVTLSLNLALMFSLKLFETPIDIFTFCDNGEYFTCSSTACLDVFVMKYITVNDYKVIKKIVPNGKSLPMVNIFWIHFNVVFLFQNGEICIYDTQRSDELLIRHDDAITCNLSLEDIRNSFLFNGNIICYCMNNILHQFPISTSQLNEYFGTQRILNEIHVEEQNSIFSVSPNQQYFASGSINGVVRVWKVSSETPLSFDLYFIQRPHNGAITSINFSVDNSVLLSIGADGSSFIIQLGESNLRYLKLIADPSVEVFPTHDKHITFDKIRLVEENERAIQLNSSVINNLKFTLYELIDKAKAIINLNNTRDEDQQIMRKDIMFDTDAGKLFSDMFYNRENLFKSGYRNMIVKNLSVVKKIRGKYYDNLETKHWKVLPINNSSGVGISSLPMTKLSSKDGKCLEKLKRLRIIELKSFNDESFIKYKANSSKLTWSLLGEVETNPNIVGSNDNDENGDKAENDYKTINAASFSEILYRAFDVRSEIQKRTQIIFLAEVNREIRLKFNTILRNLRDSKEDMIASVNSKQLRIREIQEELNLSSNFTMIKFKDEEDILCDLSIKDNDIISKSFASHSDGNNNSSLKTDDNKSNKDRALQDMMNGTLEIKINILSSSNSLLKPKWMEYIPLSDMNEAQQKEYQEFELKLKQANEEKLKYKKSLEQELKRLQIEINELYHEFERAYNNTHNISKEMRSKLLLNELYACKIACRVAVKHKNWIEKLSGDINLKSVNNLLVQNEKRISLVKSKMDSIEGKINSCIDEEKHLDKNFKRDFQTICGISFDTEKLKIFSQIFRMRKYVDHPDDLILKDIFGAVEDEEDYEFEDDLFDSKASKGRSSKTRSGQRSNNSRKVNSRLSASGAVSRSRLRSSRAHGRSNETKEVILGPMQEAAKALRESETNILNPYHISSLMLQKMKRSTLERLPVNQPLSIDTCPDNLVVENLQFVWSKLQELRGIRITKEIERKQLCNEQLILKDKLDSIQTMQNQIKDDITSIESLLHSKNVNLSLADSDLEVLVYLVQGQDEVEVSRVPNMVVYNNASLIPINVIHELNERIRDKNNEKLSILSKIRNFRKKINVTEWEAKYLDMKAISLSDDLTDLQLLRVTKDFLKSIDNKSEVNIQNVSMPMIFCLPFFY